MGQQQNKQSIDRIGAFHMHVFLFVARLHVSWNIVIDPYKINTVVLFALGHVNA